MSASVALMSANTIVPSSWTGISESMKRESEATTGANSLDPVTYINSRAVLVRAGDPPSLAKIVVL